MSREKITTIQDVARIAGVSTATVSRTLSKPSVVSKTSREAVLSAIANTGYRVNATASNLRRKRTGTVIVLLPNIANPFFSQILAGLGSILTPAQYGMLVADTQSGPDPDERLGHYLTSGQADGLILLDGTLSPKALDIPGRPPVVIACEWMESNLPSVRVQNEGGAALAVEHLVRLGHRDIGHVTGLRGNVLAEARLNGFVSALAEAGISPNPDWIIEGDYSIDSGVAAARTWLAMTKRPSALFFSSDEMAAGFSGEVQKSGVAIPRDVSIVGFDNIEIAQHLSPPLTTIRQPRMKIGVRAAEILLGMIDTDSRDGPSEVIDVEFVERGSSGPLPGR